MNNFLRLHRNSTVLAATMLACPLLMAAPAPCRAQIGISVQLAPPVLPVYVQPPIPAEGYLWTPGYWAYQGAAYSWVPGAWVEPPSVGMLWTPPYWGWGGGGYLFHAGYWGARVGYYGGVNYGFGYGGNGYEGGHWDGGRFAYNSRVNNFGGVHIANVYQRNVTPVTASRASFAGGAHGSPVAAGPEHAAGPVHAAAPAMMHTAEHPIEHAAPARVAYQAPRPLGFPAQHAVAHPPQPRAAAPEHAASHAAPPRGQEDKPR